MKKGKCIAALLLSALMWVSAGAVRAAESAEPGEVGDGVMFAVSVPSETLPDAEGLVTVEVPSFTGKRIYLDVYQQVGGGQVVSDDYVFVNHSEFPVDVTLVGYTAKVVNGLPINAVGLDEVQNEDERNVFLWVSEALRDENGSLLESENGRNTYAYPDEFSAELHETRRIVSFATDELPVVTEPVEAVIESAEPANDIYEIENATPFTRLEPGMRWDTAEDGSDVLADIPPEELGNRNLLALRFDGAVNTNAEWENSDEFVIVPVFNIMPVDPRVEYINELLTEAENYAAEGFISEAVELYRELADFAPERAFEFTELAISLLVANNMPIEAREFILSLEDAEIQAFYIPDAPAFSIEFGEYEDEYLLAIDGENVQFSSSYFEYGEPQWEAYSEPILLYESMFITAVSLNEYGIMSAETRGQYSVPDGFIVDGESITPDSGNQEVGTEPEPSEEPEPSTEPEQSEEPEPSESSEPSTEPEPSEEPEPSAEPEPSEEPEPSTEPEPSESPEPSAEPEPSESPEPSAEPEPSESPEPSAEPEPSESPEPSAEPEPSEEPEPGIE